MRPPVPAAVSRAGVGLWRYHDPFSGQQWFRLERAVWDWLASGPHHASAPEAPDPDAAAMLASLAALGVLGELAGLSSAQNGRLLSRYFASAAAQLRPLHPPYVVVAPVRTQGEQLELLEDGSVAYTVHAGQALRFSAPTAELLRFSRRSAKVADGGEWRHPAYVRVPLADGRSAGALRVHTGTVRVRLSAFVVRTELRQRLLKSPVWGPLASADPAR